MARGVKTAARRWYMTWRDGGGVYATATRFGGGGHGGVRSGGVARIVRGVAACVVAGMVTTTPRCHLVRDALRRAWPSLGVLFMPLPRSAARARGAWCRSAGA